MVAKQYFLGTLTRSVDGDHKNGGRSRRKEWFKIMSNGNSGISSNEPLGSPTSQLGADKYVTT